MMTKNTYYKFDIAKFNQFGRLSSNRERIEYVLGNMYDYGKLRAETEQNMTRAKSKSAKNLSLAINFKKEAQLFMQVAQDNSGENAFSQLKEALKSLAQAILYTPPQEVSLLANLYANKSKAHFALSEYEASLYSINHSIEILEANSHEKGIKLELYILKLNSLKMLLHYKEAIQLLNRVLVTEREQILSQSDFSESELLQWQQELRLLLTDNEQEQESELQESNSEPYFSYRLNDRCTIVNSPVVGRHFMALDGIDQGEDILEERPYSVVLTKDYLHKRCTACYKDLTYKWHPCGHCTEVVFCDRKCALRATETFHRYECGMRSFLFVDKRGHEVMMSKQHVFRMVSRVGPLEAYQTEHTLPDYCIDQYLAEPNQRDLPELAKSAEEKNRAYKMSTTLCNHNSKHVNVIYNLRNTLEAIETTVALDLVHHFRDEEPSDEFLIDFIEMIFLDLRRIGFNVFGWQNENGELTRYVANCQCLVGALINHSCVPNAVWNFTPEGDIRFVALRPIHKGDEITISYGPSPDSMNYYERQSHLNHYYFACKCDACFEDARSGENIRCLQCSGPVVYDSALNQEPWLNGKCILCYSEYHDLKQTIQCLSTAKQSIKWVKSIGLLMEAASAESVIGRATQLMYKLTQLSLPSSKAIGQSIVDCSSVIESFGKQVNLPLQDKLSLALFMNRHLLDHLDTKKSDTNTIRMLQFWFDNLLDCIVQYSSSTPKQYNGDEAAMWCAMLNMSRHLKQASQSQIDRFECATGNEPCIQVLQQIVDTRIAANEQAVAQCIRDYGGHLLSESDFLEKSFSTLSSLT